MGRGNEQLLTLPCTCPQCCSAELSEDECPDDDAFPPVPQRRPQTQSASSCHSAVSPLAVIRVPQAARSLPLMQFSPALDAAVTIGVRFLSRHRAYNGRSDTPLQSGSRDTTSYRIVLSHTPSSSNKAASFMPSRGLTKWRSKPADIALFLSSS